jgi:hypothetical protein
MNKRGQIYLVAVILIGFILFALLNQGNYVRRVIIDDDFDTLSKNFDVESARFINENLDATTVDLGTKFADFSQTFADYSRTQNPDFELLFLLRTDPATAYFCNLMQNSIKVNGVDVNGCYQDTTSSTSGTDDLTLNLEYTTCESNTGLDFCKSLAITGNFVTVVMNDIEYQVKAPSLNKAELVIVTKEDKGEQRRIFLEEGFVKGNKRNNG